MPDINDCTYNDLNNNDLMLHKIDISNPEELEYFLSSISKNGDITDISFVTPRGSLSSSSIKNKILNWTEQQSNTELQKDIHNKISDFMKKFDSSSNIIDTNNLNNNSENTNEYSIEIEKKQEEKEESLSIDEDIACNLDLSDNDNIKENNKNEINIPISEITPSSSFEQIGVEEEEIYVNSIHEENNNNNLDLKTPQLCEVCYEERMPEEMYRLSCHHKYCRTFSQPSSSSPTLSKDFSSEPGKSMGFLSLLSQPEEPKNEEPPAKTMGFMSYTDSSKVPTALKKRNDRLSSSLVTPRGTNEKTQSKSRFRNRILSKTEKSLCDNEDSIIHNLNGKKKELIFKYIHDFNMSETELSVTDGFLFFCNTSSRDSFSALQGLLKIFRKLIQPTEKCAVMLVGTMADDPCSVVSFADLQHVAKEYNICFAMTSAKNDTNIKSTIEDVIHQALYYRYYYPLYKNVRDQFKDKLSLAVLANNIHKVKQLLLSGKSPSILNKFGWAPIHVACWENNFTCVFLFTQLDPSCVNTQSSHHWTPLHCAARLGNMQIVEFLLNSGGDVLTLDSDQLLSSSTDYYDVRNFLESCSSARLRNATIKAHSHIERVIKEVGQTKKLDMSFARLVHFPNLIEHSHLSEISLIGNLITEIPTDIISLTNLTILILFNNNIEFIPEEICNLKKLRYLDLRKNKLTALNTSIGEMMCLKELLLGHNFLSFLPTQLAKLEKTLEILDIYGNPLSTIPSDVLPKIGDLTSDGYHALFAYLNNISSGGELEYNRVKIMFVGDGNVGKTSLINCFLAQDTGRKKVATKSKIEPTDTIATDGIDIHGLTVPFGEDGKEMTWDCWDYAGQEIYYTTHQFFLSPRSVYLVCYNLLDRSLSKVEYWINSIHSRARGSPIFLVGTHWDDKDITPEYLEEYTNNLLATVKPERFKSSLGTKSIRGIYAVGSRKRFGIKELMDGITQEIIRCKYVGKLYPLSWIKLESTLAVFRQHKTKPYINFEEFQRIAIGCKIAEDSVIDAARFLHATGVLCYFEKGNASLKDLIVLEPQFLTKVMASIITIRHSFGQDSKAQGILYKKDLPHVWADYPSDTRASLMQLLEQFEVAFNIPKLGHFIIPSLLPIDQPDITPYWNVFMNKKTQGYVFGRTFVFEFLPLGFFSRLFIRNYHIPDFNVVSKWRNGQILKYKNISALFRYNPTTFTLKFEVHGPYAHEFEEEYQDTVKVLRILLENIETTIEGWYETNVTITIPCSHCLSSGGYSNWEFSLDECMTSIAEGRGFVLCRRVRKIRLDFLAPDLSFSDLRKKIIKYEDINIGAVIGEGAFGTVTKGFYNKKEVAIKQLSISSNDDKNSLSALSDISPMTSDNTSRGYSNSKDDDDFKSKFSEFQREVWIMSCLNHSCVCSLVGVSMKPMAIVMDFMSLGDLYHLFDNFVKHPSKVQKTLNSLTFKILSAYDIARGMSHLHSFAPPIIHRDLRSPNIFVSTLSLQADARVKVGDFGLSRLSASLAGGEFNANWLAPEVMKSNQYNGKMDVYSFGIILWELLTLEKPFAEYDHRFAGKPAQQFKEAVISGLRPSLFNDFDKDLSNLMQQCWDGNPDKRPEFTEIVEILESIMKEKNISIGISSSKPKQRRGLAPGSRRRVLTDSQNTNETLCSQEDVATFFKRLKPVHSHSVQAICFTIDGKNAWSATASGDIVIWNAVTFEIIKLLKTPKSKFYCLCEAGDNMLAGCDDGTVVAYNIKDYKKQFELKDNGAPIRALIYYSRTVQSKKGKESLENVALTGDASGHVNLWLLKRKSKPKLKQRLKVATFVGCLLVHKQYICVGTEQNILLLESSNLNTVMEWKGHTRVINCLVEYDNEVWSGSGDGTIRIWNINSKQSIGEPLTAHTAKVLSLTSTKKYVFSGAFDKTILVWNPKNKLLMQEIGSQHTDAIRSMASRGEYVWTGSSELDAHICIWHCATF